MDAFLFLFITSNHRCFELSKVAWLYYYYATTHWWIGMKRSEENRNARSAPEQTGAKPKHSTSDSFTYARRLSMITHRLPFCYIALAIADTIEHDIKFPIKLSKVLVQINKTHAILAQNLWHTKTPFSKTTYPPKKMTRWSDTADVHYIRTPANHCQLTYDDGKYHHHLAFHNAARNSFLSH